MDILPIIYTYQLRGDLAWLPRLYTFIRQLAQDIEQEYGTKPLLLDLGEACVPESWHCAATDGRSMLLALMQWVIMPPMCRAYRRTAVCGCGAVSVWGWWTRSM